MADEKKCNGVKIWRCKKCGHEMELLCKKSKPTICKNCGHPNLEQVGECSSDNCQCPENDKEDGCGGVCGGCSKQGTFELDPDSCGPKPKKRRNPQIKMDTDCPKCRKRLDKIKRDILCLVGPFPPYESCLSLCRIMLFANDDDIWDALNELIKEKKIERVDLAPHYVGYKKIQRISHPLFYVSESVNEYAHPNFDFLGIFSMNVCALRAYKYIGPLILPPWPPWLSQSYAIFPVSIPNYCPFLLQARRIICTMARRRRKYKKKIF